MSKSSPDNNPEDPRHEILTNRPLSARGGVVGAVWTRLKCLGDASGSTLGYETPAEQAATWQPWAHQVRLEQIAPKSLA